jgi:hypothetical protein
VGHPGMKLGDWPPNLGPISEDVGSFMSMFKNKHRFLENGDEYLKNAKETICNCSNVHEKNCSKVHEKYELL